MKLPPKVIRMVVSPLASSRCTREAQFNGTWTPLGAVGPRIATRTIEVPMAKYGRKASQKVGKAMRERKRGTLRSGRSGKKVTSRKQAIAIGLSQARKAGGKVPRRRKASRKK
jgi:hypothetical protein